MVKNVKLNGQNMKYEQSGHETVFSKENRQRPCKAYYRQTKQNNTKKKPKRMPAIKVQNTFEAVSIN